jgi:hypothetical protein
MYFGPHYKIDCVESEDRSWSIQQIKNDALEPTVILNPISIYLEEKEDLEYLKQMENHMNSAFSDLANCKNRDNCEYPDCGCQ